jgi:pilus assembly protein CpaB
MMLALAGVLGLAAVFLARNVLESDTPPTTVAVEQGVSLTTVVVAKRRLGFGDTITKEYLREAKWPTDNVPDGGFTTIDEIVGGDERRVALSAIFANEPILRSKISGFGGRATLSTVVPEELRAVTIRVNDVNGVAGFVLPGDRVDVLITREEIRGKPFTDVLMQHIKVLGIDQQASEQEDKPIVARAATLEVTPKQAQKLALAAQVGTLSLTLRGLTDSEPARHRTVRLSDLKDAPEPRVAVPQSAVKKKKQRRKPVVARPVVPSWAKVTVVRGLQSSVEKVVSEKGARPALTRTLHSPTIELPAKTVGLPPGGLPPAKPRSSAAKGGAAAVSSKDRIAPPLSERAAGKPISLLPPGQAGD